MEPGGGQPRGGDWWEPPMPSTNHPWQTLDEVVESCEWVVRQAKSVRVSAAAVSRYSRELLADGTVNLIAGEQPVFDSGMALAPMLHPPSPNPPPPPATLAALCTAAVASPVLG